MIQFDQVSFHYPHQKQVVNDLSFCIQAGEYVCIIGGNGSGKSTIAKLMNGLVKPTEGKITYKQFCTNVSKDLNYMRQKIGMIFQNPEHQTIGTTVMDDVVFGLQNLSLPSDQIMDKAHGALKKVNMEEFKTTDVNHLSGGQLQRVAIAGILAMDPEVIIFDESTSMLDPKGRDEIFSIINNLNEQGITIISITHDMDRVLEGTRVIIMEEGSLIHDGMPQEVFEHMDWSSSNMTPPFVVEIREQLYRRGIAIPRSVMNMNELVEYIQWKSL